MSVFRVFLVRILPYVFISNAGKYGPEKLQIQTHFTQYTSFQILGFKTQTEQTLVCINSTIETLEKGCSKLAINASERRHWLHSGVFIVKVEYISKLFLLFLLLFSIDFKQVYIYWGKRFLCCPWNVINIWWNKNRL